MCDLLVLLIAHMRVKLNMCVFSFRMMIVISIQASMFGGMQSRTPVPVQVVTKSELVLAGEE